MPHHPSAQKRNRQRIKRTVANRRIVSAVRTAVKKARAAVAEGDRDAAKSSVHQASVELARAASKGMMPRRTASRTISRIETALHKLGS